MLHAVSKPNFVINNHDFILQYTWLQSSSFFFYQVLHVQRKSDRIKANNMKHMQITEKSDGQSDDSLLGILDLDGGHVVDLAAERTTEDGQIAMTDRDPVLADDPRRERHRARRVFVVSDLGRYGLSIGSYQVQRFVSQHFYRDDRRGRRYRGPDYARVSIYSLDFSWQPEESLSLTFQRGLQMQEAIVFTRPSESLYMYINNMSWYTSVNLSRDSRDRALVRARAVCIYVS